VGGSSSVNWVWVTELRWQGDVACISKVIFLVEIDVVLVDTGINILYTYKAHCNSENVVPCASARNVAVLSFLMTSMKGIEVARGVRDLQLYLLMYMYIYIYLYAYVNICM
jgi:hypothetical protein